MHTIVELLGDAEFWVAVAFVIFIAGMGYLGCRTVNDLRTRARFMQITMAGLREGHVHDVFITKEAPNYRAE